jgi:hypothetical protein
MRLFTLLLTVVLATCASLNAAAPAPNTLTDEANESAIEAAKEAAYKDHLVATVPPYVWGQHGNPTVLRILGMNLLLMTESCRKAWLLNIKRIIEANPQAQVELDTHIYDPARRITWPKEENEPGWLATFKKTVMAK